MAGNVLQDALGPKDAMRNKAADVHALTGLGASIPSTSFQFINLENSDAATFKPNQSI